MGVLPNGVAAITPGVVFGVTDPTHSGYDLDDPDTFGGLTERLQWRDQANVTEYLKALVRQSPSFLQATSDVWGLDLRRGSPGNPVSLVLAIIEAIVRRILPIDIGTSFPFVGDALDNLEHFGTALAAFLGYWNPLDPDYDPVQAAINFVENVLAPTGLIGGVEELLDMLRDLAAGNANQAGQQFVTMLFSLLRPEWLPLVPVSSIGDTQPELLLNADFTGAISLAGQGAWTHDAAMGRTTLGSATTTANGTERALASSDIPVTPKQEITLSAYARWTGLVSTGSAIQLQVRTFNNGAPVGFTVIDSIASPGTNGGFNNGIADAAGKLQGTYTVPAGVTSVKLRLVVTADASAGQVWFDDASLRKTGLFDQAWTKDLPEDLSALLDWLTHTVENLLSGLGITPTGSLGDKIADLADELSDLQNSAEDAIAGLADKLNIDDWDDWLADAVSGWQGLLNVFKGGTGGLLSDIATRMTHIGLDGKPDAAALSNIANIPNIPSLKVPGLQDIQNAVGQAIDGGSGSYTPAQMLTALQSKTTDWVNGFFNGWTGQSQTGVTTGSAADQVASMASTLASQAVIINSLQSQSVGNSNSGMSGSDDFERVSPTNLGGAGYWNETYGNYSGSNLGYIAIANGNDARVVPDLLHAGLRWGRFRCTDPAIQKTQTLRQRVVRVTGSFIAENRGFIGYSEQPKSRLYCRVNDTETQYVFVEFADVPNSGFRKARFGYKNGGSDTYVGSEVPMPADSPGTQTILEAGAGSNDYLFTLTRNGQGVTSWDDVSHLSAAVNGSNNGWGHGIENYGVDSGSSYSPSSVASLGIADNIPPDVLGSGGKMYRTSTSTVSASKGRNWIGTSFFQSSIGVSPDITADLTNSRFVVSNAGFYVVTLCYKIANYNTSGWGIAPVLYKNNSPYEIGQDYRHAIYSFGSDVFPRWIKAQFQLPLAVNDTVSPGYDCTAAQADCFTGEASGIECYFTIALASKSLL